MQKRSIHRQSLGKMLSRNIPTKSWVCHSLMVVIMHMCVPYHPWVPHPLQVLIRQQLHFPKLLHSFNQSSRSLQQPWVCGKRLFQLFGLRRLAVIVLQHLADSGHRVAFLEGAFLQLKAAKIGPDHVVTGSPTDSTLSDWVRKLVRWLICLWQFGLGSRLGF